MTFFLQTGWLVDWLIWLTDQFLLGNAVAYSLLTWEYASTYNLESNLPLKKIMLGMKHQASNLKL